MVSAAQIHKGKNLKVITLPVGAMRANCYLIIDKKTSGTVILDPGDDGEYIENIIRDENARPQKIVCTHGHFDHTGAVLELKLAYKIPFLLNQKDEFLLKNNQKSALHFTGIDIGPAPKIDEYLKDEDIIHCHSRESGNLYNIDPRVKPEDDKIDVIETPGHTPGSICLYQKEEGILFTGDTLFANGNVGRTDFSYGNSSDLQKSLEKISKLPKGTIIFPGHGESSSLSPVSLRDPA